MKTNLFKKVSGILGGTKWKNMNADDRQTDVVSFKPGTPSQEVINKHDAIPNESARPIKRPTLLHVLLVFVALAVLGYGCDQLIDELNIPPTVA
ncbi:MAG TPA: hypothetical protein VIH57_02895, partial [Bacteroidales bacterium]